VGKETLINPNAVGVAMSVQHPTQEEMRGIYRVVLRLEQYYKLHPERRESSATKWMNIHGKHKRGL
jgi:hypothetical protein